MERKIYFTSVFCFLLYVFAACFTQETCVVPMATLTQMASGAPQQ